MTTTKHCPHCDRTLPLSQFRRRGSRNERPQSWCKDCRREQHAQWRRDHPKGWQTIQRRWEHKHAEKHKAHQAVANAVFRGKLVRQPCQTCGTPNAEAHHEDPRQPFNITWLCRACHMALHAARGDLGRLPPRLLKV